MYVGLSWGSYSTGNEIEIRRVVQEQVIPGMKQQPGFDGYIGGIDRSAENVVGLSFWETRDQAQAMTAQPAQLASLVRSQLDDYYRVVIFTAGFLQPSRNGGTSTLSLRINLGSYYVENEAQLTKTTREQFLPIIHTFPGSLGILAGVQRSVGKLVTVSVWESVGQAQALEAQRSKFSSLVQYKPTEMYEITAQVVNPGL